MKNRINIIKFTASLLASIAAVGAPALLITSCHNGVSDAISDGASKAIPKPFDLSNVSFNDKYNQTLYVDDNTKVTSTELASIPLDSALRTFICSTVNAASSKAKISLDNFDSNLIITTDLTPGDYSNARTYTYHLKAVTSSTVVMGSKDFDVSLTATNKPTLSITGGAYMNQGYDKQSGATSAFTCNISEGDLPTITWNTIKWTKDGASISKPSFISTSSSANGQIVINWAQNSGVGKYRFYLEASAEGLRTVTTTDPIELDIDKNTISITGGAYTLTGQATVAGSSSTTFNVKADQGQTIGTLNWSIVDWQKNGQAATKPDWVSINDNGLITWTGGVVGDYGTYTFNVQASVSGYDPIKTPHNVTLTINKSTISITGGAYTLSTSTTTAGKSSAAFSVTANQGQPIGVPNWSIINWQKNGSSATKPSWVSITSGGLIEWTNATTNTDAGTYTFNVEATVSGYDNITSSLITLTVTESTFHITGGQTSFAIYNHGGASHADNAFTIQADQGQTLPNPTWSIVNWHDNGQAVATPDWISIGNTNDNRGVIAWTGNQVTGKYSFDVQAEISNYATKTVNVSFVVNANTLEIYGGDYIINGEASRAGQTIDAFQVRGAQGQSVGAPTWLITNWKDSDGGTINPDWFKISNDGDTRGIISWPDTATAISATFKVQATLDGYDSVLSNTVTVNLNNAQTGTTFLTIAQGDISNNTAYEHASAGWWGRAVTTSMIFQFNYDKTAAGLLTTGVYSIKDLTTGTNPVIDLSTCKTIVNLHVTAQASIFGDLDTTTSQTISYNDATTYIQTFSLAGGTQSQTYWLRFFGYDDEYDNFWAGSTFNVYGDAKAGAVQFKKFSGDAAELTVNHPGAGEGKNTVKPTISYGS